MGYTGFCSSSILSFHIDFFIFFLKSVTLLKCSCATERSTLWYENQNQGLMVRFSQYFGIFPSAPRSRRIHSYCTSASRACMSPSLANHLSRESIRVKQERRESSKRDKKTAHLPPFPRSSSHLSSHLLQQTLWQEFHTRCFLHNTLLEMNSFLALSKQRDSIQWRHFPVACSLCQEGRLRLYKSWRWPWS